jgi:TRAP-type uncharacterized transport system fused permease subunit
LLAIVLWGAAAVGFLSTPLKMGERIFVAVAALLLVAAVPWTDEAGFVMAAAFFGWHFLQKRRPAVA